MTVILTWAFVLGTSLVTVGLMFVLGRRRGLASSHRFAVAPAGKPSKVFGGRRQRASQPPLACDASYLASSTMPFIPPPVEGLDRYRSTDIDLRDRPAAAGTGAGGMAVSLHSLQFVDRLRRVPGGVVRADLANDSFRVDLLDPGPLGSGDANGRLDHLIGLESRFRGVGSFPVRPIVDKGHTVGALCRRPPVGFGRLLAVGDNRAAGSLGLWRLHPDGGLTRPQALRAATSLAVGLYRLHRSGLTVNGDAGAWILGPRSAEGDFVVWLDNVLGSVSSHHRDSAIPDDAREADGQLLRYALGELVLVEPETLARGLGPDSGPAYIRSIALMLLGADPALVGPAVDAPCPIFEREVLRSGYVTAALTLGLDEPAVPAGLCELAVELGLAENPVDVSAEVGSSGTGVSFIWPDIPAVQGATVRSGDLGPAISIERGSEFRAWVPLTGGSFDSLRIDRLRWHPWSVGTGELPSAEEVPVGS